MEVAIDEDALDMITHMNSSSSNARLTLALVMILLCLGLSVPAMFILLGSLTYDLFKRASGAESRRTFWIGLAVLMYLWRLLLPSLWM